jgi:hypothetical protein
MDKRLIASAACALLAAGTLPPAAAQAATTGETAAVIYWEVETYSGGKCLSTYIKGAIRALPCDTSSDAQEWHWVDSSWNTGFRMLKNKWTGRCLISTDPVSSGSCEDWTSRHWKDQSFGGGTSLRSGQKSSANTTQYLGFELGASDDVIMRDLWWPETAWFVSRRGTA